MTRLTDFRIVPDFDGNGSLGLQQTDRVQHTEFVEIEMAASYAEGRAVLQVALADLGDSNLAAWADDDDIDVANVRACMQDWLDAYMTLDIDIDYNDLLAGRETFETLLERSGQTLLVRRAALLAGDFTPLSGQSSVN